MKNPYSSLLRVFLIASTITAALIFLGNIVLGQEATPPTVIAPADAPTPLAVYVSIVVALASGLVAIWKNNQATKAQKIIRSVVLGVEQATQLPEVRAAEEKIKATIKQKATDLGVQPLLHEIVKDLT